MTKTTKTKRGCFLRDLPRLKPFVLRGDYVGSMLVQSDRGWTRAGPTWKTELGWVTLGIGVKSWGTTAGLAELASDITAKPAWHAPAVTVSSIEKSVLFAVQPETAEHYPEMADLEQRVAEWLADEGVSG